MGVVIPGHTGRGMGCEGDTLIKLRGVPSLPYFIHTHILCTHSHTLYTHMLYTLTYSIHTHIHTHSLYTLYTLSHQWRIQGGLGGLNIPPPRFFFACQYMKVPVDLDPNPPPPPFEEFRPRPPPPRRIPRSAPAHTPMLCVPSHAPYTLTYSIHLHPLYNPHALQSPILYCLP